MKPSIALQAQRKAIRRIVEKHRACNPRVFGSVLQGCPIEGSDLDLLIDPTPATTLFDIGAIRHELLELLGVPVALRSGVRCYAVAVWASELRWRSLEDRLNCRL
ncbi:MAG TPA: nucleotidyltransferase domain-containing protein [Terriglobales bacterium]|nr:nucleotidyltransferase domain-containing protein [Terriglobales bacterium]